MKTLLIGHRGVGKTSFLQRLGVYHKNPVETLDLDALVEKGEGLSIDKIFQTRGEAGFRELEKKYLADCLRATGDSFIAVGAGFEFDDFKIPPGVAVWWIKRPSDSAGRIFLNRPRLDRGSSAFDEYRTRFAQREDLYRRHATDVLVMEEGFDAPNEPERKWVMGEISHIGMDITLTADAFKTDFNQWFAKRQGWGLRFFELRDDLLSSEQLKLALKALPAPNVLFSFRSPAALANSRALLREHPTVAFDWAHELGPFHAEEHGQKAPRFFSFHERGETSLGQALARAEAVQSVSPATTLKIAVTIDDFAELALAHEWMMQDPALRVVLPSSSSGRWAWYRLWQKPTLALNFVREDGGSAADQPTVLQTLRAGRPAASGHFAAVLGQPVDRSRTPAEQFYFFASHNRPVYQIDVSEHEWAAALDFLRALGLKAAAVTSPLKLKAFASTQSCTEIARQLRSVNTLWFEKIIYGDNTDAQGLAALLKSAGVNGDEATAIGVWGGGGTLALIRSMLPAAQGFSARTGQLRETPAVSDGSGEAEVLIWAVSRARFSGVWPSFAPAVIIDLNYGDDSPGRELALTHGSRYISGLAMFKAQAQGQRQFWKTREDSENVSQ